jgi:D-alanyl-D-alanine carboxypeptidase
MLLTIRRAAASLVVLGAALSARAQTSAEPPGCAGVRSRVEEVLATTGAPSASIAIVRDGRVDCAAAYGSARLEPKTPASPAMRYSIGSVSKQFTATAILMLAEEGRLSLDDPVSRFLPDLTRAKDVRIRQLLSHTSGYQDYWPQDYVPPFMKRETTAAAILDRWAKRPLDFAPGSQYQYTNTAYVAAGLVVEKASGMPLMDFLERRVFRPLDMRSVLDIDRGRLTESDPTGYQRFGLGPLRVAPKEGKGWLFAAGELAMTAEDLAKWNAGVIGRRLLKPASYAEQQTAVLLTSGVASAYGLGVSVANVNGHRTIGHGGEVSGFTTTNAIFPDDRAAVSVLVNLDASNASEAIAEKLTSLLFNRTDGVEEREARAKRILEGLQKGTVDRSLLTENASSYFTDEALRDLAAGLAPLGPPTKVEQTSQRDRGGMTFRGFDVGFGDKGDKKVAVWERDMPDGRIEQFQVMPKE